MKKIRLKRNTVIKFIGATLVFYIFLASNTFHVGDTLFPPTQEYLYQTGQLRNDESTIQTGTDNTLPQIHGAAEQTTTCDNEKLCSVINFIGEFTEKEEGDYLAHLNKIGGFINETLVTKQTLEDSLKQVTISKKSGKRGYANRDSIVLNIATVIDKNEFFDLLCHEIGHILDLGMLQGRDKNKDQNFTEFGRKVFGRDDISLLFYAVSRESESIRKAESAKKDFCSGYGMSDPFEDFAECLNLYLNHNQLFRLMARKNTIMGEKYNKIASLFDGIYINQKKSDAMFVQNNTNRRPRDTTRIVKN